MSLDQLPERLLPPPLLRLLPLLLRPPPRLLLLLLRPPPPLLLRLLLPPPPLLLLRLDDPLLEGREARGLPPLSDCQSLFRSALLLLWLDELGGRLRDDDEEELDLFFLS